MNALSSSDLYNPPLEKVLNVNLNDKWNAKDQNMAKDFIVAQFTKKALHPRFGSKHVGQTKFHPSSGTPVLQEDFAKNITLLSKWDVFVWAYEDEELFVFIAAMLKELKLLDEFNISSKKLFNFLKTLRSKYQDNLYHNFLHAFDVTNMMFLLMKHTNATQYLTPLDVFVLMIAALCHDVDHPGLTNSFQVAVRTDLAITYSDQSVLEMHHSCTAWKILSLPENNILANLSIEDEKEFRKTLTSSILATDMSNHFELVTKFSTKLDAAEKFSKSSKEDRQLLCNILLHTADISNLCRPYEISRRWSDNLFEEMLLQVWKPFPKEAFIHQ